MYSVWNQQESRVKYNQQHYKDVFHEDKDVRNIDASVEEPSLLTLLEVCHITVKYPIHS